MRITIMGDICPAYNYNTQFNTGDCNRVFGDILPLIRESDVVVGNLESPATNSTEKLPKNSICLKAKPQDIKLLKDAGVDGLAIANNHILDYRKTALMETLNVLNAEGVFFYGAGTKQQAAQPYYVNKNGKTVGFLAFAEREFNCAENYGVGANLWEDLTGPAQIKAAKANCDFLIVQYHGGIEHYIYPSPYLQKKCRAMAESGADFITCQHSHCIGTREKWNRSEILYGQGNTLFGYEKGRDSWNRGLLVRIDIAEKIAVKYIPIVATPDGERLAAPIQAKQILQTLETESAKITDIGFVKAEWKKFCNKQSDMYLPMAFARGRIFNKLNRMTKGRLIKLFTRHADRRNVMNLIRCDAHREVLQTILENEYYAE